MNPALLCLEPLQMHHAAHVQRLAEHPQVTATTNLPHPYPPDGARTWLRHYLRCHAAGKEHVFAIMASAEGLVGVTGLIDVSRKHHCGELGYWVGVPYWGRGYATAANRLLLAFAFEQLGLAWVWARALARNAPSRRVLEKLGLQFVALETNPLPKFDSRDLLARYEISATHWQSRAEEETRKE
jgi:RimJ/RimL family protein N-acetyltransferase